MLFSICNYINIEISKNNKKDKNLLINEELSVKKNICLCWDFIVYDHFKELLYQ